MKPRAASVDQFFRGTASLRTLAGWLQWTVRAYERHGLALGQVADNAHDEALYLLLRTFDLPLDSPRSVLRRVRSSDDIELLKVILRRRIIDRFPAGYLTREAWLGGLHFYVDERVIIPRSYFVELIPQLAELPDSPSQIRRAVDVCTGSGCLAILMAHHFPLADIDAIDLSAGALAVAQENVQAHQLAQRIRLYQSDVFDAVPSRRYELILSNPPYEPSAHCETLPAEFQHEPRLALDGGRDGLDIIRKLLIQAKERLTGDGLLVIEVGGLRAAMEAGFPELAMEWLATEDGSDCVVAIRARDLGVGTRSVRKVRKGKT